MERWLREVVVPGLAPTTSANYELFTRLYVVPDLGSKRLDVRLRRLREVLV